MLEKLKSIVGQEVAITAGDDCLDGPGIYFRLRGTLEAPEEGSDRWYVRVRDGYHGTEGIGFHIESVEDVYKQVYNWEITLKETLKAPGY